MKKIKIYIILPILILIVNCGYTPLLDTNQINLIKKKADEWYKKNIK